MDAQTLFREGVTALRDQHDPARARQLLAQSLKLDPDNETAWLWLSRTTDDPQKKLQCVERALQLNPENAHALALREKLSPSSATPASVKSVAARPTPASPNLPAFTTSSPQDWTAALEAAQPPPPAPRSASSAEERFGASFNTPQDDQEMIDALLVEADRLLAANDTEGAVEQWVRVLDMQVSHPVALQNAVKYLFKLGYKDDASELIDRAINAGNTSIPVYLTGIDLARVRGESGRADDLREAVALLPDADEALILKMVDHFIASREFMRATFVLEKSIASHPESQALLLRMADFQENVNNDALEAHRYYERAARIKGGKAVKGSKAAEQALKNFTPVVTDRERGSIGLALREALGFGVFFLFLAWQDAGLNLLRLGSSRWLGVLLSIIGGYLLVTALSAPQQKPLAAWFGGKVPEEPPPVPPTPAQQRQAAYEEAKPPDIVIEAPTHLPTIPGGLRAIFATVALILLVGAFMLVFSASIQLLQHPVPPTIPSIQDLLSE